MVFVIINIIAIVNLLLLSVLLLVLKTRTSASRFLAAIIFDPIFSMLLILAIYYKQADHYPSLFYLSYLYDLLWAPLYYYTFRLILCKGIRFPIKKYILHFSPFIVACIYFFTLAQQPETYRHEVFAKTISDNNYPWQFYIWDYITIIQVGVYLYIIYKMAKKYNRHIEQVFSNTQHISAKWVERSIILSSFLCAVIYFPSMINVKEITPYMVATPVCSLILYCYLVYRVIYSPLILRRETLEIIKQTNGETEEKKRSKQINVIEDDTQIQLARTLNVILVKKKLFLDPELNIQVLAEYCETRVHTLSAVINKHYNKNFFDYINYYRVEEAKKLLSDPEQKKYSIDTIAEKSGFSSRSAFYKAFKKNTELTPGEYIKITV
jgi:AraC-like DNA-binding protein